MKSSTQVTDLIRNYLEQRSINAPLFSLKYANSSKSIGGAVNYLCQEAQKSGVTMMNSDSVFSIITHYFDEDNIEENPQLNWSQKNLILYCTIKTACESIELSLINL